jgi:hypothetical protein
MSGSAICCKAARIDYHAWPTATARYPYSPDLAVARLRRQGPVRGHEDSFPPPPLSAGSEFRKEITAGMGGNEEDAPIPAI